MQLTEEEIQSRLNKVKVTPELLEQLFGDHATPITRSQALQGLIDGIYKYALTSAKVLHDAEIGQLRQQLEPVREVVNRMYRENTFNKFYSKNPNFKEYDKAVQDAIQEVLNGQLPEDIDEDGLFEKFAAASEGRIKQFKPDFTRVPAGGTGDETDERSSSPQPGTPPTGGVSSTAPASTAPGGFSGAPASAGGASKASTMDVWD